MNVPVEEKPAKWEEYEYRHEHIWNNLYKLTFAVAVLSVLPYAHREVVCVLGAQAIWPSVLAAALATFGILRGYRELKVLQEVRTRYRRQNNTQKQLGDGWFTSQMLGYLTILLVAAIYNVFVVWSVWIPAVKMQDTTMCFAG